MRTVSALCLVMLLLAGCATVSVSDYPVNARLQPVPDESVVVLHAPPTSWYKPLGELHLSGSIVSKPDKLMARLQHEAGKLGGDGLILSGSPRTEMHSNYNPVTKVSTPIYTQVIHAVAVSLAPEDRPVVAPGSVIIYPRHAKLPKRYEIVAERACSDDSTIYDQLRNEAGRLGANAVFLGSKSSSVSASVKADRIIAVAVYVPAAQSSGRKPTR